MLFDKYGSIVKDNIFLCDELFFSNVLMSTS